MSPDPLQPVNFNSRANNRAAQLIRLLEQWVHNLMLQKVTKKTKIWENLIPSSLASVKEMRLPKLRWLARLPLELSPVPPLAESAPGRALK
ncbi:MAG TPA: hypothetical protein VNT26_18485 [Candidatus Sulfotelmatobacter sp.]|nr:hypothetical protein [Candidatus Sulfotelmatobacter sp.]